MNKNGFVRTGTALLSCVLAALLSISAFAAEDSGLAAFTDVKTYSEGTFSDVAADAWYHDGVKTVYAKGIMDGTGGGKFAPSVQITWTQAVTIAARLHAVYHGAEIPAADGAWYIRYMTYARAAGILPGACPADADGAVITRKELAGLFRNVLSDADLPAINDAVPPDLSSIASEFRAAVGEMYASGIFTGKEGGRFDPDGKATRAEIATIVTRLLCPAQRVGKDSRTNPLMAAQYGNFLSSGGVAVMGEGTTWYLVREDEGDTLLHSVVARTDAGEVTTLYSAGDNRLFLLSLGSDGKLYFVQRDEKARRDSLLRLDVAGGKPEIVYTSPRSVESYLFYDGKLYLVECLSTDANIDDWPYRIGRLENGTVKPLLSGTTYAKARSIKDTLYAFGGKLYFLYGDEPYTYGGSASYHQALYSLDLADGKLEKAVDRNGGKTIYMSEAAYDGATVWFLGEGAGESWTLNRVNLLLPELVETVAELPAGASVLYPTLFANGSALYYQASGASRLWKVAPSGALAEAMRMPTPYYEHSTVLRQGTVAHMLAGVNQQDNGTFSVLLPDGGTENYLAFLNKPYLKKGHCELPAAAGTEETWPSPETAEDWYNDNMIRQYRTQDGGLVFEVELVCDRNEARTLSALDFTLEWDGGVLSRSFSLNDAIKADTRYVYSVVFPGSALREADASGAFETSWTFSARDN